jgi:hypothetical protein
MPIRYRVFPRFSRTALFAAAAVLTPGCGDSSSPSPGAPVDKTPPAVSILAPAPGTVTGTITLTANATDSGGIALVDWKVNEALLGAPDSTAPYEYSWNTALNGPGIYAWTAVAKDKAGNTTESAPVTYQVTP